jgi:hypothetical protein
MTRSRIVTALDEKRRFAWKAAPLDAERVMSEENVEIVLGRRRSR